MQKGILTIIIILICFGAKGQSIDRFFNNSSENEFKIVANQADGIDEPTDLDFNPLIDHHHECWITQLTHSEDIIKPGIIIMQNSDTDTPQLMGGIIENQHFLLYSNGIELGDNGNFGTSGGNNPNDSPSGNGPVLWLSLIHI